MFGKHSEIFKKRLVLTLNCGGGGVSSVSSDLVQRHSAVSNYQGQFNYILFHEYGTVNSTHCFDIQSGVWRH
jgi:hypothetical protein